MVVVDNAIGQWQPSGIWKRPNGFSIGKVKENCFAQQLKNALGRLRMQRRLEKLEGFSQLPPRT